MNKDLQRERETTILFNDAEEQTEIWSASPSFQRRMAKLAILPLKTAERERGERACWYIVPKAWVKISPPLVRHLTEEQRQAMAERARRAFSKRRPFETRQDIEPPDQKEIS